MKEKYDKLFNLVKSDIYDSSLSEFPKPCILGYVESNGLPDSQKQWLEFRENEAHMYFILSNKDESIYYGKLFEITKRRMYKFSYSLCPIKSISFVFSFPIFTLYFLLNNS